MEMPDQAVQQLAALSPAAKNALAPKLLAMGDDELILAHRDSEWCGHAPILEEDIAFANIAQDELGHATLWYGLLQALDGSDPDHLVYFRQPGGFRNLRMVELPNGDWAFSMLRQYLFDCYEMVMLQELVGSVLPPLAQAAAKARREEVYHLRHTGTWVQRMGLGTQESRRRMQHALDELWPYTAQLFVPLDDEEELVAAEIVPQPRVLFRRWWDTVVPFLQENDLAIPALNADEAPENQLQSGSVAGRDEHTPHLQPLVDELQSVARMDPEASW